MDKILISLVLSVFLLGSIATAAIANGGPLQSPVPTEADYTAGGGTAPIVKAKWETPDENSAKPWTQITSPMVYQGTKPITYWVIATDYDGYDNLDSSAYVDVYHPYPNGSFKYQVELIEIPICNSDGTINQANLDYVLAELNSADASDLVKYNLDFTLAEVAHELVKCSAKAYMGSQVIDYHQMCGEFDWEYRCIGTPPNCQYEWTPSCFENGYRVEAYVFDKNGLKSDDLVNYFEYICEAGVEIDFTSLDFETVLFKTHKWIEGDNVFDSPKGPACRVGTSCVSPTIRNIGNIPVEIEVMQDDMDFGYSGLPSNPDYNVKWDARLAEYAVSVFDPYEVVTLDGVLGLCNTKQISFSIYVEKTMQTGQHTGTVEITPVPIPFDSFCYEQ